MKVKPLYDRVLIKRTEKKEENRAGIIIPDTAKEKPMEGKIVSVGSGRIQKDGSVQKLAVKAGDTVLFGKYAGTEIKINDVDHIILKEDEILGIIQ